MSNNYYNPTAEQANERRKALREFDFWNKRALLSAWSLFGKPNSYIDFGSGSGAMVEFARSCNVDAIGVDLIAEPPDVCHDLRQPLDLHRTFEIVTSIEVAEHLNEGSAAIFAESIVRHLSKDGGLIFTAALPGQPGDNHLNCQPPAYWRKLFTDAGLTYLIDETPRLAHLWTVTTGPMHHLPANLQVFVKGAG